MTDYIPIPQPPLTPEQIAVGKEVEIRRLTAKVRELEQAANEREIFYANVLNEAETERVRLVKANEHWHLRVSQMTSDIAALTQAHQQLVKDRDMQASTIRSMRATIDGLNVLVDSLNSGNERRDAQHQQAMRTVLATQHDGSAGFYGGLAAKMMRERDTAQAQLQQAVEALAVEQRACINDVCMYCANRARGYCKASGPNSAGNWTHQPADGKGADVLCRATGIMSRKHFVAALATHKETGEDQR